MTIFIGADHRGLGLKNEIIEYLQNKNIRVEDLGAYELDETDDFPDFAKPVAEAVLQQKDSFLGIVICGSGVGVNIAANRYNGIYCGLGFNIDQVKSAREHDHINILALPADYIGQEDAKKMIDVFLATKPLDKDKYKRRLQKIDNPKENKTD
jgi:ribose 5-phosphate isomerase B